MIIDIADLSVIFLSYDEPKKDEFWLRVKNIAPWAKRVDGVKGSDTAHKAAACISDTERFILIDGDNLPDENFFTMQLDFTDKDESYANAQYRWRARNIINGLQYGNGGISSWTKTYVMNMRTHENSDGNSKNTVDFCLDSNDNLYWSMHDCYSTTYPNGSKFQAWRAGFREGVKMCLNRGIKPSITDFQYAIANRNLNNLTVWHNVGADVDNGLWAMYGARYGTYLTMLTSWDYTKVQSFDAIEKIFNECVKEDIVNELIKYGEILKSKLKLPICMLNSEQSEFFKLNYNPDRVNMGILIREMDIIFKK